MFIGTKKPNQEKINREAKINKARAYFAMLSSGESRIDSEVLYLRIKACLEGAGVGYEALDPNGKKTGQEMLGDIERQCCIKKAQQIFADLATTKFFDIVDTEIDLLKRKMKKAKVGYEVLDPSGKKTGQEMLAVLEHRCRENYIKKAQRVFADLATTKFSDIVEVEISLLEKALKKAKVGYEALDISDRKVAAEMKAELDRRVKKNFICAARSDFDGLSKHQGDRFLVNSYLNRMNKKLKTAGVGYEVLDPTGKKSAETIEKEIRALLPDESVSRPIPGFRTVRQSLACCGK